ncbi:MAG: helix-turn-helix domain-containing protein [Lachnospiraceae bacterium]|nr:helix-turn-helix domain-containing protein [Lachnospiraceae bacterium]
MSLDKEWFQNELYEREISNSHRPMEDEYTFYSAVRSGDLEAVQNNLDKKVFADPTGMGILSKNPLTNKKYHFVITTAMITRYCVEGGMELEQAYRLSDFYILKMDSCNSEQAIDELHRKMTLDFTNKMHLLKKNTVLSKPITLCIDYIYKHINDRITVDILSEYVKLSTSYLSRLFKKELGISVSDYIREKKIENAQNLLKYTDYSLVEIANYLSFSSESHFIHVFEDMVGMTPKKYRDTYYRASW